MWVIPVRATTLGQAESLDVSGTRVECLRRVRDAAFRSFFNYLMAGGFFGLRGRDWHSGFFAGRAPEELIWPEPASQQPLRLNAAIMRVIN
jgi:hypothetical protein